jgi:transposase
VKTFGATTAQILAVDYLLGQRVTTVVMEATSDYWKPFYYVMEDKLPVMLVNAKHARNIPGRKTDVSDAAWLAQLGAYGLLRASFIPPEPVRHLRDLTRARSMAARGQGPHRATVGEVPRIVRDQAVGGGHRPDWRVSTSHAGGTGCRGT